MEPLNRDQMMPDWACWHVAEDLVLALRHIEAALERLPRDRPDSEDLNLALRNAEREINSNITLNW